MKELNFIKKDLITKGWSSDKKYCVTKEDGTNYLLRVSSIDQYEIKKSEFEMMKQVSKLGVFMCQPIEFGMCEEGVYSLQSWIEGKDAEEIIPYVSDTEAYLYGIKAGEMLKKIHSIPAPVDQENWETRFNHKINRKLKGYNDCPIKFAGAEFMMDYINEHRHLLKDRPQCYQHGDYHIGNMMIEDKILNIIDFNRNDYGDPWEEFNRIVWCAQISPLFASGMINGYFAGNPPMKFWKLLALYISSNTLSAIPWAIPFGQKEIDVMLNQAQEILEWYDNMKNPIPTWYFEGYYIQYIDDIPYKLKEPFNLDFIKQYGNVFKVFDDQDSGNICFGVQKDNKRYFIKFAGAPTEQYHGNLEHAITRLKESLPVYKDLTHPNLIKYIKSETTVSGFALLFEWTDASCMGRMYPQSHKRFMQMPLDKKLNVFDDILSFHAYAANQGYVAIDFYDGCIMYDFDQEKTMICDIDFYHKTPYINKVGRMWGSSRFMSPEEFTLGAEIDEITNVYTMGATAFALFGNYKRTIEDWQLNERLYQVALKAINDDRSKRHQSIQELIEDWKNNG